MKSYDPSYNGGYNAPNAPKDATPLGNPGTEQARAQDAASNQLHYKDVIEAAEVHKKAEAAASEAAFREVDAANRELRQAGYAISVRRNLDASQSVGMLLLAVTDFLVNMHRAGASRNVVEGLMLSTCEALVEQLDALDRQDDAAMDRVLAQLNELLALI